MKKGVNMHNYDGLIAIIKDNLNELIYTGNYDTSFGETVRSANKEIDSWEKNIKWHFNDLDSSLKMIEYSDNGISNYISEMNEITGNEGSITVDKSKREAIITLRISNPYNCVLRVKYFTLIDGINGNGVMVTLRSDGENEKLYETYVHNIAYIYLTHVGYYLRDFIDKLYINCVVEDSEAIIFSSYILCNIFDFNNIQNITADDLFNSITTYRQSNSMVNGEPIKPYSADRNDEFSDIVISNTMNSFIDEELRKIDSMSGTEFENYAKILFEANGAKNILVTRRAGDYGVDVIAEMNGIKCAIQCKRHQSIVGVDAVKEVYTGARYYNCNRCIVLTNNNFTSNAEDWAKSCDVILWDRNKLKELIGNLLRKGYLVNKQITNNYL